jgi:signal transduction histidine kinase
MKKPINSILSGIQNVNENISSKIYYYDEDEFKIIVDELNKLYSNIELSIKEIKRSEIEDKHYSEFKGQILKVLSHEIRTPLHSIIGFSDHIKRELKNEKSILVANTIKKSAKDLLKKFERLMERAKIESESASIKLNFEKNNLLSVIFENATKYESICRSKNIKFIFDNSDFDTNHVKNSVVDSDKLKKIFNELLDNAAKFTSEGYIKFIVKTTEENLKVIIKDTGIGIPSKDIYRLYEPFFHSENYLRRKYEGLGIGLGIVKYYVEIMGGDIFLKAEDVGTCVSFEIPLLLNNQKIENFNFEKEIQTFESKYFDIDYEKKDFIIVLKEIKEAYIKIHDSEDKTEIFSMLYCLSEKLLKFKFDALNSINLTLIQMEKLYSHQRNRFLYKELIKKFEIRKL